MVVVVEVIVVVRCGSDNDKGKKKTRMNTYRMLTIKCYSSITPMREALLSPFYRHNTGPQKCSITHLASKQQNWVPVLVCSDLRSLIPEYNF